MKKIISYKLTTTFTLAALIGFGPIASADISDQADTEIAVMMEKPATVGSVRYNLTTSERVALAREEQRGMFNVQPKVLANFRSGISAEQKPRLTIGSVRSELIESEQKALGREEN